MFAILRDELPRLRIPETLECAVSSVQGKRGFVEGEQITGVVGVSCLSRSS
jgi:hypothetical protein